MALLRVARSVSIAKPSKGAVAWISDTTYVRKDNPTDFASIDLTTGTRKPLLELSRTLHKFAPEGSYNLYPSPDGHWILIDYLNQQPSFQAVSTDGNTIVSWKRADNLQSHGAYLIWLASSQEWAMVSSDPSGVVLLVTSVDNPKRIRKIRVPALPQIARSSYVPLTAARQNKLLICKWGLKGPTAMYQIDTIDGTFSCWKPPIAPAEEFIEVCASPDGNRLAWVLWRKPDKPLPSFLAWLPEPFQRERHDQAMLVVTDSDGSHRQEIGCMSMDVIQVSGHGMIGDAPISPRTLRWTPSGKYLSFEFDEKLWQVPVP